MVLTLVQRINDAIVETQNDDPKGTKSISAYLTFLMGEELIQQPAILIDYQGAYEKYVEALKYDPSYQRAISRAKEVRIRLENDPDFDNQGN